MDSPVKYLTPGNRICNPHNLWVLLFVFL